MENSVKNKKTIGEVFGEVVNSEDKIKQTFEEVKTEQEVIKAKAGRPTSKKQKNNIKVSAYISQDIFDKIENLMEKNEYASTSICVKKIIEAHFKGNI